MKLAEAIWLTCAISPISQVALAHDTHQQALVDRIKADEGWRAHPYRDSVGKLTVGFGTNLDAGITPSQGECMVVVALDEDEAMVRARWRPYQTLSAPVRAALLGDGIPTRGRWSARFRGNAGCAGQGRLRHGRE